MDSKPLAHVPLSVFSQSSSLMSVRASQAMEKALRNKPRPRYHSSQCNYSISFSTIYCCFLFDLTGHVRKKRQFYFTHCNFKGDLRSSPSYVISSSVGNGYPYLDNKPHVEGDLLYSKSIIRILFTRHNIVSLHPESLLPPIARWTDLAISPRQFRNVILAVPHLLDD